MKTLLRQTTPASIVLLVLLMASPAIAGPPLLCFPFDIGDSSSLPWAGSGNHWKAMRPDYDVATLADDTTALLTPTTPILVRMETLRRAAIYATRDTRAARSLLGRLTARTQTTDGGRRGAALALFDAGYFAEALKELAPISPATSTLAAGIDGYAMVQRSLDLTGHDPAIEFAAALMTTDSGNVHHAEHERRARAGAQADVLLARNLTQLGRK